MLSENIKLLFHLLSCSNAEIARYAGCSRSYISHILADKRNITPGSKPFVRLTEGIYKYAETEELLDTLRILTDARDTGKNDIIPALTTWLSDNTEKKLPSKESLPSRNKKPRQTIKHQEFGNKLDAVMNILELSNARLARSINVDVSLISRWRNGLRSPHNNQQLSSLLVQALLKCSQNMNCNAKLAKLAELSEEALTKEDGSKIWAAWLFETEKESVVPMLDQFLELISGMAMPVLPDQVSHAMFDIPKQNRYWNKEGLRQAVIRFLSEASTQGGELWLYSDESMEWLAGDETFYSGWQSLMFQCIQAGIKIKIIHNIDRNMDEMLTAISGWMPLYISGLIEPYVCKKPHGARFTHTFFLRPGAECIYGTGINGASENWYEYITDDKRLTVLQKEYETLISASNPLVRIYSGDFLSSVFRRRSFDNHKSISCLTAGLTLATMPEPVLNSLLKRSFLNDDIKNEIREIARQRWNDFSELLSSSICEMVTLPSDETLFEGKVYVDLNIEMITSDMYYTEKEYAQHAQAVYDLLKKEKNYELYILPELPFHNIQMIYSDNNVTVVYAGQNSVAFSFDDPYLVHAFREYIHSLRKRYHTERETVCQKLMRYISA